MARRNLITDVAGLRVGNAHDARLASGVTAIVFDEPAVAAVDVRGGAPGTRETDLLDAAPHGRAHRRGRALRRLGLRARRAVRRAGLAARAGPRLCDRRHPHSDRQRRSPVRHAQRRRQELGPLPALPRSRLRRRGRASITRSRSARPGAGFGATTIKYKGGLGSASAVTRDGHMAGALVAVNACGNVECRRRSAILGRAI